MPSTHDRTADQINRSFAQLGASRGAAATDDGVVVTSLAARQVLAKLSFVQGGARIPFVNTLLRATGEDIVLRGDEGRHLARALDDVERQVRRNQQIDRGRIPGAMSGSEVTRLIRKNPHLFTR